MITRTPFLPPLKAMKKFAVIKMADCFQRWVRRVRWDNALLLRNHYLLRGTIKVWRRDVISKTHSRRQTGKCSYFRLHHYLRRWIQVHKAHLDASLGFIMTNSKNSRVLSSSNGYCAKSYSVRYRYQFRLFCQRVKDYYTRTQGRRIFTRISIGEYWSYP